VGEKAKVNHINIIKRLDKQESEKLSIFVFLVRYGLLLKNNLMIKFFFLCMIE